VPAAVVLEVVAERFAGVADQSGRTVEVQPQDGIALDADPVRLEQAVGNLVDNALTHGAGRVTLSARPRDGLVELHVEDEGSGFPPEFIASAFDRFSRSLESRTGPGTGLGLSIVELIARAHGGDAGARNRTAGGADVWIAVRRKS